MEIEAKFSVPDAATLEQIAALDELAGFALAPGKSKQVRDVYVDTAGRALYAAGYACRRRTSDAGILLTLKSLARATEAIHRREELEITLPSDLPPAEWQPSPARDLVQRIADDQPLLPLCELTQTRRARMIQRAETPLAEMTLDQVRVQSGERALELAELEVELLPAGTEAELQTIVAELQTRWQLHAEPRSKFERALEFVTAPSSAGVLTPHEYALCAKIAAEPTRIGRRARALLALDAGATPRDAGTQVGLSAQRVRYWRNTFAKKRMAIFPAAWQMLESAQPAPHLPLKPGLTIDDAMSEAARKTLLFHFQRMLDHEIGTRAGEDSEELHDMRVATRRMRAALQVFADYLDADSLKPFAKALRRTARTLGVVRDLDVFRGKTQTYLDALPAERRDELAPLLAAWESEYAARRAELVAHLDSEEYVQFKEAFGEFLDTPGAGAVSSAPDEVEPQPYRVRHCLPGILFAGYAQVRAYDEWLSQPNAPLARYHQLRIASKRLRYALEFFQEVLGASAKPLIEKIKCLQDHLGNLQDATVASEIVRAFLMWGTWGAPTDPAAPVELVAPGVAAYLAARQAEIRDLVASFSPVWVDVVGAEFNRQLAERVAVL